MMKDTASQRVADRPPLQKKPYEECHDLIEFLARHLEGTDYQFAKFYFPIPTEEGEPVPFGASALSVFWEGYGSEEITAIALMHPDKGVLFLADASRPEGELTEATAREVGLHYGTLMRHHFALAEDFSEHPLLGKRPRAIGEAVVVAGQPSETVTHPDQVPSDAVLTRDDLADFPACLERVFEQYTWPACRPVSAYGHELIEALTHTKRAFCRPGEWFIDVQKSVDHDLAVLDEWWGDNAEEE